MKIEDCKIGMRVKVCKADAPESDLYAWNSGMNETCDGHVGTIIEVASHGTQSCEVSFKEDGSHVGDWYIPASALSPVEPMVTQVTPKPSSPLVVNIEREGYFVAVSESSCTLYNNNGELIEILRGDVEKVLDLISAANVAYELARGVPCDT